MELSEIRNSIIYPLEHFKVLTKMQLQHYAEKVTGQKSVVIDEELKRMKRTRDIIMDDFNVSLMPGAKPDRKEIIAFWALIALIEVQDIGTNYARSIWPSTIVYYDPNFEKIARITVCDNEKYDPDIIAVRDTHDKFHKEIIVGNGFEVEDINPEMMPNFECIYINIEGKPMMEIPEIAFSNYVPDEGKSE